MITQQRLKELLHYCPETGLFTWRVDRNKKTRAGDSAGTIRPDGYIQISIDYKLYRAHRLAWLYVHGRWPVDQLDHINHHRADNRIANLREATNSDNKKNQSLHSNNTSGVCGVLWHSRDKRWVAQVRVDNHNIHLGNFTDKDDAIAARRQADITYGFHANHGVA